MHHLRRERRQKPDLLQRSFLWLGFVSWGLFWLAVFAFNYPRPEIEYGLVRYWDLDFRSTWEPTHLSVFLYALWGCFGITLVSIALVFRRNRRLNDNQIYYFELLFVIALGSLIAYYI